MSGIGVGFKLAFCQAEEVAVAGLKMGGFSRNWRIGAGSVNA